MDVLCCICITDEKKERWIYTWPIKINLYAPLLRNSLWNDNSRTKEQALCRRGPRSRLITNIWVSHKHPGNENRIQDMLRNVRRKGLNTTPQVQWALFCIRESRLSYLTKIEIKTLIWITVKLLSILIKPLTYIHLNSTSKSQSTHTHNAGITNCSSNFINVTTNKNRRGSKSQANFHK